MAHMMPDLTMTVSTSQGILLAAVLFCIGLTGVLVRRASFLC